MWSTWLRLMVLLKGQNPSNRQRRGGVRKNHIACMTAKVRGIRADNGRTGQLGVHLVTYFRYTTKGDQKEEGQTLSLGPTRGASVLIMVDSC